MGAVGVEVVGVAGVDGVGYSVVMELVDAFKGVDKLLAAVHGRFGGEIVTHGDDAGAHYPVLLFKAEGFVDRFR